jgi:hypothetical protein
MNSTAPLIPGKSAAGIFIGSPIETVLKDQKVHFLAEEIRNPLIRYRSPMVDLWVKAGVITQIMVHDGYSGKLLGVIGLGSTITDIETHVGLWEEDEEDNLVIQNLPGFCFEVEGYFPDLEDPALLPALLQAPIKEMYVFDPNEDWTVSPGDQAGSEVNISDKERMGKE